MNQTGRRPITNVRRNAKDLIPFSCCRLAGDGRVEAAFPRNPMPLFELVYEITGLRPSNTLFNLKLIVRVYCMYVCMCVYDSFVRDKMGFPNPA